MPGIAGILGPVANSAGIVSLPQMVKTMLHERFYTSGNCRQEAMQLAVGWVCHPDGFDDCLPIWNETRDIGLIFTGEHFAEQLEVERLRSVGHCCPEANASYLVHLYEQHGMAFLRQLNGIFSGILIDLRENKVVLFNDRYGMGRIYFHEAPDGFYFASEAKALLKVLPGLRKLDTESWGEFFSCGCALQNRTLFSGISLLPGASAWTFRPGEAVRKEVYFQSQEWEQQTQLSEQDYYEKLKSTFAQVLPKYFQGKQRVAVSVTGGLDSRMVMAWATCSPFKLETYTFGGPFRECSDVTLGRRVARLCQQYHQVIPLTSKFFPEFAGLAKRSIVFTDGALDVTGSPGIFSNRFAREIAPVRLTGNYGDEILRGNIAFRPNPPSESLFSSEFLQSVYAAANTYANETQGHRTSFVAFKQMPWYHYGRFALEQSQLTIRSPYLDNELVATVYQSPPSMHFSVDPALRLIAEGNPFLARVPTDRGAVGQAGSLASKVRGMYQGFTIRAEYAFDYGMPNWLVRMDRSLNRLQLAQLFLGRHKYYHFRVWYRDQLSNYVKGILLDPRTLNRPYLNSHRVQKIVTDHVTGRGNYTLEIHKLLTSELIQRQLIEHAEN